MTSGPPPARFRWWQRTFTRFAASRVGSWLILNVTTYIDPPLMRATRGRVSFGCLIGLRLALLTTTGAKSGRPRTVALLYFEDGGDFVLIGSNAGMPHHPAWVHNLRAHPRAVLTIDGRARSCLAHEAEGPERERLWQIAESIYGGFREYHRRAAGRRIAVFVLRPDADQTAAGG